MESASKKWGRNHHVLHQGRSTPHLYLQEEAFMACNQGQPQEFTIDPGLPLQARKACKQKGGKKFTKQHDVDSYGEDGGKGKFLLPQHYFNDSVWAKTKGAKSTEIHQHVTRIVKLPIPWPSSWSINWNQAPGFTLCRVNQVFKMRGNSCQKRFRSQASCSHELNTSRRLPSKTALCSVDEDWPINTGPSQSHKTCHVTPCYVFLNPFPLRQS